MTPDWLLQHVVPFTNHFYSQGAGIQNPALTLAYPLLWAAMSDEMEHWMDPEQRGRIRAEFHKIDTLPDGVSNPVVRVGLSISQAKDILVINEMAPGVGGSGVTPGAAATGAVEPPTVGMASPAATGGFSGVDTKRILDTMFTQHQQLVAMFNTQHQSHTASLSSFRENVDARFKKVDERLCR